jgi:hypothetical protein
LTAWASVARNRSSTVTIVPPATPRPAPSTPALKGAVPSAETRRKMSEAQRRRGARPPKAGRPWTAEEDALVKALPAREVAARTGRTLSAVWSRWQALGMPDGRRKAGRKLT